MANSKKADRDSPQKSWWPFVISVTMAYLWGFVFWSWHVYVIGPRRYEVARRAHPLPLIGVSGELPDILLLSTGMLIAAMICFHWVSFLFFPKRRKAPHMACILALFTYAVFYIKYW